jgi:disulfide oxidoreductase YuzD
VENISSLISVISMDELRNIFSFIAIVISLISMFFSLFLWRKSNKPIITAIINTGSPDNPHPSDTLDLIVYNSGNRPATNIKLRINPRLWFRLRYPNKFTYYELNSIFNENVTEKDVELIQRIFSNEVEIPILINGDKIETAFGCLNYIKIGSKLPITIIYSDLDNRKHKSRLKLIMNSPKGFGGSTWKRTR